MNVMAPPRWLWVTLTLSGCVTTRYAADVKYMALRTQDVTLETRQVDEWSCYVWNYPEQSALNDILKEQPAGPLQGVAMTQTKVFTGYGWTSCYTIQTHDRGAR